MFAQQQYFIPFYGWTVCIVIYHILFIHWTFRLLPYFGYYNLLFLKISLGLTLFQIKSGPYSRAAELLILCPVFFLGADFSQHCTDVGIGPSCSHWVSVSNYEGVQGTRWPAGPGLLSLTLSILDSHPMYMLWQGDQASNILGLLCLE